MRKYISSRKSGELEKLSEISMNRLEKVLKGYKGMQSTLINNLTVLREVCDEKDDAFKACGNTDYL